jgi:transcriptional regulator with XRE-family HTH domain
MIKNQKQTTIVKKEIADLLDLITDMEKISREKELDFKQQVQLDIYKSRVEELKSEITEYELLISKDIQKLEITTKDLPKAIISFRVASGLTQKKFADMMEIQEQQIQRYEQNDYLTASFERVIQILQTLNVEVTLKKEFYKETKVIDFSKFLMPEAYRNGIADNVRKVAGRNQLMVINK